MERLDDLIATELGRVAATAPVWGDPAARVRAAARRDHRRRVALLAAACVTVALAGIAVAVPRHRDAAIAPLGDGGQVPASPSEEPAPSEVPSETATPTPRPEPTRTTVPSPTPKPTTPPPTVQVGPPTPTPSPTESRPVYPPPYGPGMTIGKEYDYSLNTHCGIEFATFDGRRWRTEPLNDGSGNPPDGWGNPTQSGAVVLLARDRAEFRGDNGETLLFEPTDEKPSMCM
jgi:hypothetical protein